MYQELQKDADDVVLDYQTLQQKYNKLLDWEDEIIKEYEEWKLRELNPKVDEDEKEFMFE